MTSFTAWLAAGVTVAILFAYELLLLWQQRRNLPAQCFKVMAFSRAVFKFSFQRRQPLC